MRHSRLLVIGLVSLVMTVAPRSRLLAQTQTCTITATTSAQVTSGSCNYGATLLRIPTISRLTTSTTSLSLAPSGGDLTATELNAGSASAVTALTVTVLTNAQTNSLGTNASSVKLSWLASATAWTGTGCPLTLSDLTFATAAAGTYAAVPTAATNLLTNISSSSTLANRQVTLYFRTLLSWNDTPAPTCTLPLTFTVSP